MIGLVLLILGLILIGGGIIVYQRSKEESELFLGLIFVGCTLLFTVLPLVVDVSKALELQGKIIFMQPSSIDAATLARAEAEYKAVSKSIEKAFEKYQIQAQITDLKGLQVYVAPFSAGGISNFQGLGDIER